MTDQPPEEAHRTGRSVRLDTLVRLRWLAVIGQTTAVLVVYFGLDYELPIWACLAVIALAAWLNVALRIRFPTAQRLEPDRAAWLLAFDTAELAVLLFFTGGLQNPFALLFLGPVLISATALPARMTLMLGGFAVACATVLVFVHDPLPWDTEPPLELPQVYVMGVWLSILLAIAFIGLHAWQITEESRQLADALAATELVLAREQHLSQIDGLAAAAAHELGTPLATITLIAKELQLAIKPDSEHADDVRLLNPRSFTAWETCSRTPSISPTSGSKSPPPGTVRTSPSPSPMTVRALPRRSWTASANPMSPTVAGRAARARRAAWGWGSSSPRPCWSARAPRSTSRTARFRTAGRSSACTGAGASSNARPPSRREPLGY